MYCVDWVMVVLVELLKLLSLMVFEIFGVNVMVLFGVVIDLWLVIELCM